MDEYEELLRLHLARLSREKLQRMAQMVTAELRRRTGADGGGLLLGEAKTDDGPPCPVDAIVEAYHRELPMLPRVRLMTDSRRGAIRRLWVWVLTSKKSDSTRRAETAEQALQWISSYFERAKDNDFLMGRGAARAGQHAGWKPDLDFLLTQRGMKHVIERTAVAA